MVREKEVKETTQEMEERQRAKREMNCMKLEALRREYERCSPGCNIPNHHLPFFFINDLESGETVRAHERDHLNNSYEFSQYSRTLLFI